METLIKPNSLTQNYALLTVTFSYTVYTAQLLLPK